MYLHSSFSSSFIFNQEGKRAADFAKTEEIKNILNRYVSLVEHSLPSPAAAKGEESIPLPPAPSTGTSFEVFIVFFSLIFHFLLHFFFFFSFLLFILLAVLLLLFFCVIWGK